MIFYEALILDLKKYQILSDPNPKHWCIFTDFFSFSSVFWIRSRGSWIISGQRSGSGIISGQGFFKRKKFCLRFSWIRILTIKNLRFLKCKLITKIVAYGLI